MDVRAATARIFPNEESGPGALEAGVVIFIDRQLAGPYGRDARRYTQEPFVDASPSSAIRGRRPPRNLSGRFEDYRRGIPS